EDDFMEEKGCEVYVSEQTGEVQVRFRGLVKAVVKVVRTDQVDAQITTQCNVVVITIVICYSCE
ncbi:MAG: hypothetical protein EZS28_031931, partial [Streblomastix strix]